MKLENKDLENITYGFGIAGLVTFLFTTVLFLAKHHDCNKELDTTVFNDFGSFLSGSAGLLFTIATTILVYLTYQTQKDELKEAKNEATASRVALQSQARTNQLQQFENTFFNLLTNHREVLKSLQETWVYNLNENEKIFEGKKLIDVTIDFIKNIIYGIHITEYKGLRSNNNRYLAYEDYVPKALSLKKDFEFDLDNQSILGNELGLEIAHSKLANPEGLSSIYEKVFEPNRSSLGHYARNLYHLIKFVHEYKGFDSLYSEKEIEDLKYKYVRLVRAQLSNNELILLALNSITNFGEAFVPFIEKYKLLKNTNIHSELNEMEGLITKYPHFKQPE